MLFFWTFYPLKNPEKHLLQFSQKHIKQLNHSNINDNKKCFLSTQKSAF